MTCRMDQNQVLGPEMGAADLAPNSPVQVVLVKLLIISIFLFPICEMGIDVAFVLGLL